MCRIQTRKNPPLFPVQPLCVEYGPPLSLDQQLCGILQPEVLLPNAHLYLDHHPHVSSQCHLLLFSLLLLSLRPSFCCQGPLDEVQLPRTTKHLCYLNIKLNIVIILFYAKCHCFNHCYYYYSLLCSLQQILFLPFQAHFRK